MDGMQHLFAPPTGLAIGTVTDNVDSQTRGRVKVTLLALGVDVWASCIVPSAGKGFGVALLPKVGEVVLVAFLSPDQAFVLGSVWSGQGAQPDEAAPVDKRYVIKTPAGTSMVFDDDGPSLTITTPAQNSIALTDAGGGTCTVTVGTTTVQATSSGVTVTSLSSIELKTATLTVTAASVAVNASTATFSGSVICDTLVASTVMGTSYTPGVGNLW